MCINTVVIVISLKMHLLSVRLWHLTFQLQNHVISMISKVIPSANFEHFIDHSFCDSQTVGVGNELLR